MYNAANNASSQLATSIGAADTNLTVVDGANFPDAPFVISIDDEIIEVGAKDGNTFSALVRGLEGTAPAAHASGARVENRFTAGTYQQVVNEIDAHKAESAKKHITESGSNTNGSYIKFDDGTQICIKTLRIDFSVTGRIQQNYPATFISIPSSSISFTEGTSSAFWETAGSVSIQNDLTGWYVTIPKTTTTVIANTYLLAVGRWK